jgi:hypothetical protein
MLAGRFAPKIFSVIVSGCLVDVGEEQLNLLDPRFEMEQP